MCNYYLINELALGNRSLGFEFLSDKNFEVVEMTHRTVRENIKNKRNIKGLQLAKNGVDLVLDESYMMRNYMVKTHINNIRPKYESDGQCVANIMYLVIGSHEEDKNTVYDVISSRFERTTFSEEKLKAMYDLGIINGGCKVEDDKVILPSLGAKPVVEEPKPIPVEKAVEQPKSVEAAKVAETELKEQEKKHEPPKQEVKEPEKKSEPSKPTDPKKVPTVTKPEQKPIKK